jgi:ABC-type glycerol-3-phosphate transport system substrate-binding protein
VATVLAALLSACGSAPAAPSAPAAQEQPAAGESAGEAAGVSGEIDFWLYESANPTQLDAMDGLKQQFETANPGTTINIVYVPKDDYITKMNTAIATGVAPDAAYLDQPLTPKYANDKVIDVVPEGLVDESTLYEGALGTNRVNGELYGLPLSQTCVALFYNKDLVPTPPTTWDELLATARQVHEANPEIAAFNMTKGGGWGGWLFPAFVATAGGKMLDEEAKAVTFADQPAIDALTLWRDLQPYSPYEILDAANSFETGRTAMTISGPWSIPNLRDNFPDLNWGVALIPQKTQFGSNIGGENGVVFSTSDNKPLAWEWLKFLTSTEANIILNRDFTGNFPVNLESGKAEWLSSDEAMTLFVEQLKYAQPRPTVNDWLKINDEMVGVALANVLEKGADPATELTNAADQAKQVLGW